MLQLISPIFIWIFLTASIPSISAFYGNFVVCTTDAQCYSNWCGPTDQSNSTVCKEPQASLNAPCGNDRECRSQLCSNNQCASRGAGASGIGSSGSRCTSNSDCNPSIYICRVESNECGLPGSRINIRDAGCGVSEHCDTNTCDFINGICSVRSCTTHYQCPRDMFCGPDGNQANAPKICKKKERSSCTTSLQCESGMCSGGWCLYPATPVPVSQLYRSEEMFPYTVPQGQYCFSSQHCAPGLYCAPGDICMPKVNIGQQCRSVEACTSGYCKGGICVGPGSIGTWCTVDANCTSSNYCGTIVNTNKKQCMMKGAIGASCIYPNHNMCESGKCDSNGRCIIANGVNANCSVNAPCSYDTYCDISTNKCIAKLSQNSQCTDNIQCMSGTCLNDAFRQCNASIPGTYGHFCSNSFCNEQHYCRTGISPVVCLPKGDKGAPCSSGTQCTSNTCYGTPLRCVIPGDIGTPCTSNSNCTAGSYCPTIGTRICTALLGLGEKCNNAGNGNSSCASGWCSGNLCHSPPSARSAGSSCVTHTDCDSGLWCWSTSDGISTCHPKRSDGNKCQFAETCISNGCTNNICGGSPQPNGYVTEDPTPTTSPGTGGTTPTPTPTPTSGAGTSTSTPTPTSAGSGATTAPPTSTPAPGAGSGSGPNSGSLYVPTIWSLLLGMLSLIILV